MRSLRAPRTLAGAAALGLAVCLAASAGASPMVATAAVPAVVLPATTTASALAGMKVSPLAANVPSKGGATLAPEATGSLTGRVIVVDPGHNGIYRKAINRKLVAAGNGKRKACNSSGTATNAGFAEHKFNWKVAVDLVAELRARGATVVLTRPNNSGTGPCVNERAAIGNRAKADLVISIHADGSYSAGARGFHLIISKTMVGGSAVEARSRALAVDLRSRIAKQTGMPRSTYIGKGTALSPRTDIAGLNLSKIPAVMLEAGNMRNKADAALLTSAAWRLKLATALADGVGVALKA
jgi:N-acetylmuramoyl-L-alanine amidase